MEAALVTRLLEGPSGLGTSASHLVGATGLRKVPAHQALSTGAFLLLERLQSIVPSGKENSRFKSGREKLMIS